MSKNQRSKRRDTERAPAPGVETYADDADPNGASRETAETRAKREQWERERALAMRERDRARRKLFTAFMMWTICPHKQCIRARACTGDTEECRVQRWRKAVPDEIRTELFKTLELMSRGGHSHEEASRLVREDMQMRAEMLAKLEAQSPRPQAAPAVSVPVSARRSALPPSPGPRIRGL